MDTEGKDQLGAAQFSAARASLDMKEGNPECTGGGGGMGVTAAFPGPSCILCFGTLFLTKSQCSYHINTRTHQSQQHMRPVSVKKPDCMQMGQKYLGEFHKNKTQGN